MFSPDLNEKGMVLSTSYGIAKFLQEAFIIRHYVEVRKLRSRIFNHLRTQKIALDLMAPRFVQLQQEVQPGIINGVCQSTGKLL